VRECSTLIGLQISGERADFARMHLRDRLAHVLEAIHEVGAVLYPNGKLIECFVGLGQRFVGLAHQLCLLQLLLCCCLALVSTDLALVP
jgi:hypothetical protein